MHLCSKFDTKVSENKEAKDQTKRGVNCSLTFYRDPADRWMVDLFVNTQNLINFRAEETWMNKSVSSYKNHSICSNKFIYDYFKIQKICGNERVHTCEVKRATNDGWTLRNIFININSWVVMDIYDGYIANFFNIQYWFLSSVTFFRSERVLTAMIYGERNFHRSIFFLFSI